MLKNILLVGVGGFAGSAARYLVYVWIDRHISTSFPLSTFAVNVVGSLILGVLAALFMRGNLNESSRLLLSIGFCGSFTTFSTFAYENLQLLAQRPHVAGLYTLSSIVIGLVMVYLGYYLGRELM